MHRRCIYVFAANSTDGVITLSDFKECMLTYSTTDDRFEQMCNNLFALFNTDEWWRDFNELASGLSVLCGGTSHDKVRAVFDYDVTRRFISFEEMVKYLSAVFKVMYASNESMVAIGASATELALVTAREAFETADLIMMVVCHSMNLKNGMLQDQAWQTVLLVTVSLQMIQKLNHR